MHENLDFCSRFGRYEKLVNVRLRRSVPLIYQELTSDDVREPTTSYIGRYGRLRDGFIDRAAETAVSEVAHDDAPLVIVLSATQSTFNQGTASWDL